MDGMDMDVGIPWLTTPIALHSSRAGDATCELTPAQCAYRRGHWRNWYHADQLYAFSTVYLCLAMVALFAVVRGIVYYMPRRLKQKPVFQRMTALSRILAYQGFTIPQVGWYSPPLGVIILGLIGGIFFFGMTLGPRPYYWPDGVQVSYGDSPPLATRAGWMALALFPFVLASASKYNLITLLTGISHEKLQPFHRWSAWAMLVLALVHTFPFIVYNIDKGDMEEQWHTNFEYWSGVAAIIPQAYLTLFSTKTVRDRYYEFFKSTHLFVAAVFAIFFFLHCDYELASWDFFIAAGVVYFVSFLCVQMRTFCEHGLTHHARVTLEHHGLLRISIETAPHFLWAPGQHMFLRFASPRLGLHSLTAHPFTICSLPGVGEAVFHVRPYAGVTARLASLAKANGGTSLRVLLDGPYGGMSEQSLQNADTMLIAVGGSGAGYSLALIEDFMQRTWQPRAHYEQAETGSRHDDAVHRPRCIVVAAAREKRMQAWYLQEVHDLVQRYGEKGDIGRLDLRFHITDTENAQAEPTSTLESEASLLEGSKVSEKFDGSATGSKSSSAAYQLANGRPDLPALIQDLAQGPGSVGVAVCGPESMAHDVRNAMAGCQRDIVGQKYKGGSKDMFLHVEHFGW